MTSISGEFKRLKELNPETSDEDISKLIEDQVSSFSRSYFRADLEFRDQIMSQYVTVAFLSHALCEATINARLAIGLARSNREQLFSIFERADIKEKWVNGLKVLSPTYELPRGCALYETLQHLKRERNALVHYKITLEVFDGSWQNKLDGSRLNYTSLDKQIIWMKRFFSLPYDLNIHANSQLPDFIIPSLCNPTPIQLYTAHSLN